MAAKTDFLIFGKYVLSRQAGKCLPQEIFCKGSTLKTHLQDPATGNAAEPQIVHSPPSPIIKECQQGKVSMSRECFLIEKTKKFFFFFYPHTLTFRLKRPVYRGFKGEGKCEGRNFTLTLSQQTFLLTGKQRTTRTLFSFAPHEPKCFFHRKYAAMQGMIQNNVVILQHRFIPSIQNTRYGWGN